MALPIPTEPIGSIPRSLALVEAVAARGGIDPAVEPLYEEAIRDTIARFGYPRKQFLDDLALSRFSSEDRNRMGVHKCPGSDGDSSAEVDYAELLPSLFDYSFSPFCNDTTTTRETAFEKIRSRGQGTALAAEILWGA